jgi:hypothetical protein
VCLETNSICSAFAFVLDGLWCRLLHATFYSSTDVVQWLLCPGLLCIALFCSVVLFPRLHLSELQLKQAKSVQIECLCIFVLLIIHQLFSLEVLRWSCGVVLTCRFTRPEWPCQMMSIWKSL